MKFPKWAPEKLVREYGILSETIRFRQALEADPLGVWDDDRFAEYCEASTEPHYDLRSDELLKVRSALERLLTLPDMEGVWRRLDELPRLRRESKEPSDLPLMFWESWIATSLHAALSPQKPTKKQHKEELAQICRAIGQLKTSISESAVGAQWAEWSVRLLMAERRDAIVPLEDERQRRLRRAMFIAQLPDVDEAREPAEQSLAATAWRDVPIASRWAYWTVQLNDLSLLDVLDSLSRQLEELSKEGPSIPYRSKRDGGLRPLLTREVADFLESRLGRQSDALVALVVESVLGGDTVLGSEDVAAYIRPRTRKKT